MRLPSRPPDIAKIRSEEVGAAVKASYDPALREFIQRVNAKYNYWDIVKRLNAPRDLTGEQLWIAVKLSRIIGAKPLPFMDPTGRNFTYWLPESLLEALHEVDQNAGGNLLFEGGDHSFFPEAKNQLIISSLMEEAIATSQIEGAITTRDQAKEMLRANRTPRNKSEQMVLNSYRTIKMLRSLAKEPLSIDLLNEIQREITIDTLDDPSKAGKFRTREDEIIIVDESNRNVVYNPPDADLLSERVQRLVDFANTPSTDGDFIHPLVKAAVLHFWLAYEHPYTDGNGRTARALFYWYMLKNGYWLFEYLTISRIVYERPIQYYRSFLYTEYDDNDLTYSLAYMLKVTRMAIKNLRVILKEKQRESELLVRALRNFPGLNYRQRELLKHAIRDHGRVYTIASHQRSHGVSYQTARTDLLDLVKRKLMIQSFSGKQMVFFPEEGIQKKLDTE